MANLIRIKQIESGSALNAAATVGTDFSQSIANALTNTILTVLPRGVVSGSAQLTSSYDMRYTLSGSISQTTWDTIANKPSGIVSGSSQVVGILSSLNTFTGSLNDTFATDFEVYTTASAIIDQGEF
jgi:hypothetical protein